MTPCEYEWYPKDIWFLHFVLMANVGTLFAAFIFLIFSVRITEDISLYLLFFSASCGASCCHYWTLLFSCSIKKIEEMVGALFREKTEEDSIPACSAAFFAEDGSPDISFILGMTPGLQTFLLFSWLKPIWVWRLRTQLILIPFFRRVSHVLLCSTWDSR